MDSMSIHDVKKASTGKPYKLKKCGAWTNEITITNRENVKFQIHLFGKTKESVTFTQGAMYVKRNK